MDDAHLNSLRQDPAPAFTERLRDSLESRDARASGSRPRALAVLAPAIALAGIVALLSVPAVRASAQSFLMLFRVVNFVAVPVDESRLAVLQSQQLDPAKLIGDRLEVLEDPGPPLPAVSPAQAGTAAGMTVHVPEYIPTGATLARIEVKGHQRVRVTADAGRLREVMDALGIQDLRVPDDLDGQVVNISIPPVVTMQYDREGSLAARVLQARAPEIGLPEGIDLAALGEIGLRILGLSATDAREFSQAIDWQTTLLVPLPPSASSFTQVSINGYPGIAVERVLNRPEGGIRRSHTVMWSGNGEVFGLEGVLSAEETLRMAESLK